MAILLLTLFFAGALYLQVPSLIKGKNLREIIAYSFIMGIGILYSYGYVLDIEMPNPTKAIDAVFRPVTQMLDKLLS